MKRPKLWQLDEQRLAAPPVLIPFEPERRRGAKTRILTPEEVKLVRANRGLPLRMQHWGSIGGGAITCSPLWEFLNQVYHWWERLAERKELRWRIWGERLEASSYLATRPSRTAFFYRREAIRWRRWFRPSQPNDHATTAKGYLRSFRESQIKWGQFFGVAIA